MKPTTSPSAPPTTAPRGPRGPHPHPEVLEDLRRLDALLVEEDGENMETSWHRAGMELLIQSVLWWFRGRDDFYVAGDIFIYFSAEHVYNRDFRGPDFFFVDHVPLNPPRPFWVVWHENGRYPDVIIEILSPSTEEADRTTKFAIYERTFRTHEYYLYDFDRGRFEGWRIGAAGRYEPIAPNDRGWLWCERFGLWLGPWDGEWARMSHVRWPRLYDPEGRVAPTEAEFNAEQARLAQEQARQADERAAGAEAEVARLRALLAQRGSPAEGPDAPQG
jgi:Uma2 family endonuclease